MSYSYTRNHSFYSQAYEQTTCSLQEDIGPKNYPLHTVIVWGRALMGSRDDAPACWGQLSPQLNSTHIYCSTLFITI